MTSVFAIDVPSALIDRAQRGEAAAFEQMYRWFERPVYTLALRMLGSPNDAQDVLQDTMLKLLDNLNSFRGEAPFWAWLRQIAVNQALMRLRRRGHEPMQEETDSPWEDIASEGLLPPQAADASRLMQALQTLSPTTRSVLWLYHAEGYTHEEIASVMDKTTSFSKSQVARGLKRLREALGVTAELTHA